MRYLLDTHIILWAAADAEELPERAREIIQDQDNELYFSSAVIWEIAIKSRLGRADFALDPARFAEAVLANGYLEMPISARHSTQVYQLPDLHRDPFDRIMIAQAEVEEMTLLTHDEMVAKYRRFIEFV